MKKSNDNEQLISLSDPDKYLNVFLPDGEWLGFFYRRDFAVEYLRRNGYELEKCEISKRRPERVARA